MIGIITIGDLQYSPYIEKYQKILEELDINYEVVFWNRSNLVSENLPSKYVYKNLFFKLSTNKLLKVYYFFRFSLWLNKIIKKRKYDKLIVVLTLTGLLTYKKLIKKYSNSYIFDIRDYSYEHISQFYKREKNIIEKSYFTCLSSNGFKKFLPNENENNYVTIHNFDSQELSNSKPFKKKNGVLTVGFVGAVRYFAYQKHVIEKLHADKRFRLVFHGDGAELDKFCNFCTEKGYDDILFSGRYDNKNKAELLKDIDIINNVYGQDGDNNEIKYSIPNRLYDGAIYGIPQLVEVGTYKHDVVTKYGLGIGISINDELFADTLYDYYMSIDEENFNSNCQIFIKDVIKEDNECTEKIRAFVTE